MSRGASEQDAVHIARCLALAEAYRGRTSPNPLVGCVIVDRRGRVIAEGAHHGPGTAHAEVDALRTLGGQARGATLYVNLEPCNHQGRTPPCAPAVRAAGVARVVVGTRDPIAAHAGGIALLRRAKIDVTVGVLAAACERANLAFFTWARQARPAFTLKAAITLDGKIATVGGESKWITGAAARDDVMRLRDTHDAVMVGIGTVLADDPQLTARRPGARDPVRVVIDTQLRTPPAAQLLPANASGAPASASGARPGAQPSARTIIACGPDASQRRAARLTRLGAEIWRVGTGRDGRLDLADVARKLAEAGLLAVLVEGGGQLHASLLAHGLADQLVIYVAPKLVGGPAPSWVGGDGLAKLADAYQVSFEPSPVMLGDDLRLTAVRKNPDVIRGTREAKSDKLRGQPARRARDQRH